MRARAGMIWFGEMPTKRALSEEKRYPEKNEIRKIQYKNVVMAEKETIGRPFVEYYTELFDRHIPMKDGFAGVFLSLMPKLEPELCENMEAPIRVWELENAIDDLKPCKSPGPEGLSTEFYKAFKRKVAVFLYDVLVEAHKRNVLPQSFKETHITLIPKCEDAVKLLSVKAYRPIRLFTLKTAQGPGRKK